MPHGSLEKRPVDYVNPFVDTANQRWFFFSSACRPFGMVNLSPDTILKGAWNSGYRYEVDTIGCFSHVHAWQLSGIPVLPTTGPMKGHLGNDAYKSHYSHETEIATPGYHRVVLDDYGIEAELTSTLRVGFHRYTFPAASDARILFDLGIEELGPCGMSDAWVKAVSSTEIEGFVECAKTRRRPKPTRIFFVATTDRPFERMSGWEDGNVVDSCTEMSGADSGCALEFSTESGDVIQMKVALSYCSVEQARRNMQTELPHWDFDQIHRESGEEWNEWLSRIEVEGGTETQRIRFYTDLWHALQGRRVISDNSGTYSDMTGPRQVIRQIPLDENGQPRYRHYGSDAFWGAQWNISILWTMICPRVVEEFCNCFVDMYENGGLIPRGPTGGNYSFVMSSMTTTPFFVAAYTKGIRGFDIEKAYEGLRKNHFPGGLISKAGYEHDTFIGGGAEYYIERGYVPWGIKADAFHLTGPAYTLEYAYEDWCLAQLADALGHHEDRDLFMDRARNWQHIFDPETKYMRPRMMDGTWLTPFTPESKDGWEEANSYIDTWFVPHDLRGLAGAMGGCDKANERLNWQFEMSAPHDFVSCHGEDIDYLNFDNQPGMGLAHVFNYTLAPWLSQKWVRRVHEQAFSGITPEHGYRGDEDQGQIGAYGVLIAMGLFDIVGGAGHKPWYEITSPIFDRVRIHLDPDYYRGGTFTIEAADNAPGNIYIQSAALNDEPLPGPWFPHAKFADGAVLKLTMGPEPNKQWGATPDTAPPSMYDS